MFRSFFALSNRHFLWLVYFLCVLGFVCAPSGLVQTFRLNGMTDYAAVVRVIESSGGWADGLHMLFGWALRGVLHPFDIALALSFVLPLIFLAVLLGVVPLTLAGVVAGRRRVLSVLFVLFMPSLFSLFAPGSVGVQAYGVLVLAMVLACLMRPARTRKAQTMWMSGALIFAMVCYAMGPQASILESTLEWSPAFFFRQAFLPTLAMIGSFVLGLRATRDRRWRFWVLLALQLALVGQAVDSFYGLALWQLVCVPSLTALFFVLWDSIPQRCQGGAQYLSEIALVLAFTFVPVGLVPAALGGKPWLPDVLLAPFVRELPVCDLKGAAYELAVSDAPARILNHSALGPELRLRAPRHSLVAPWPESDGALKTKGFFDAETDADALYIVNALQVDYVFACPDGQPVQAGRLLDRLIQGRTPSWLLPMGVVFDDKTLLYKVMKDKE